jgi:hypothetical protein
MKRFMKVVGWVLFGLCGVAALALVLGIFVRLLWNGLMPELFGLPEISYLQAVGLLILSHLLFKGHALRRYSDRRGTSDHGRRFASRVREHMAEEKGEA